MASPAEIVPTTPETLPSDFSGWDSEDSSATRPVDPNGFKAVPGSGAVPKPPAQVAIARLTVSPVVDRLRAAPSLTPAAAFAEAEDFFQTFRPSNFNMEDLEPRGKRKRINTKKMRLAVFSILPIVLLLTLIPVVYPRLMARTGAVKQSVAPHATPVTQPTPVTQKMAVPQSPPLTATHEAVPAPPQPAAATEIVPPPHVQSEMMDRQLTAPARIPNDMKMAPGKEAPPPSGFGVAGVEGLNSSGSGTMGGLFNGQARPQVKVELPRIVKVSAGVAVGLLVRKTEPIYPPIAKTAHVSGTVVLQATISKTGSIDGLHVVSGPDMLRQAALDAVRNWRYKPYMLNNEPIAVETTVNVIFSLGG